MAFTAEEWNKIKLYLSVPVSHHRYLAIPEVPAEYEEEVRTHMATIERIDAALITAEPDMIADEVGDLKINPARQVAYYRQQGSAAIQGISRALSLWIYHNKYQQNSQSTLAKSQILARGTGHRRYY